MSEQAGYYERIRLGELIAAEVQRRREGDMRAARSNGCRRLP